jgi:hypothetical protein
VAGVVTIVIARNLLGRLNARTPDDLQRIAALWLVPLPGTDRGRHVGVLYRAMTDVRQARSMWDRLDNDSKVIVHSLAVGEAGSLTVEEIAARTSLPNDRARSAAIRLFQAGMLAREGDTQELPIGVLPRLFLAREIGQVFRRVQDELDSGDLSRSALRVLLETMDDAELEQSATIWGLSVIPGQRRRSDLVAQIVRQVANPGRLEQIVGNQGTVARAIWTVLFRNGGDAMPLEEVLDEAGYGWPEPSSRDYVRATARIEGALAELEEALLVLHTYRRDGSRWLFVPREVINPGEVAATLPLQPLQPLAPDKAPSSQAPAPGMLAWDLLTLVRELSEHGAPVWIPGEPLSRPWQRRLNSRLWAAGDEVPPPGYVGFLLYLGVAVGVLVASDQPLPSGTDKRAIRPIAGPGVREWARLGFDTQMERLKDAWLASDAWIEGRERDEVDVWGADWRGFRRRLLEAVSRLDPVQWLLVSDLARWLADREPTMVGTTFTAASARATPPGDDERVAATSAVIEIELETAFAWFGLVQVGTVPREGTALLMVETVDGPDEAAAAGPSLEISESGLITLLRPTPLHVWSLSAFADLEALRPVPTYQLRPGSVGRALGARFDLEQITRYLVAQSGADLPGLLQASLREWTVGYRRVRMRRSVVLHPDSEEHLPDLTEALVSAGFEVLEQRAPDGGLMVLFPAGADGQRQPDDELLSVLRAHGFVGQWGVGRRQRRRGTKGR